MRLDELRTTLESHRPELEALGLKGLYVFGSVARGEAKVGSDIDFVVELEHYTLKSFVGLKLLLESWLGSPVDLATFQSLKPALRQAIQGDLRRVA
ncbi:nucleotidyltransferase family protein [Meiothermus granaticius]|uniref:Nucleotidyltransferase domain protein n=1 Tax=Meiothermus granaticius NBRC 107808 TaxID=1227551 RepID=A0A399F7N9_9DEIN|nr:nucleotidyltransferase domain-containing protein [Meiothermus granaticius]MCL6526211.1 nucleotidyltransferase domain-containing protein [Thermaceae bacterium]RIH92687.1 Nucleotidyltransferase domain protein [Meiothermus granaticius NBRC 107808]GEM87738.1 nucleotidyltransferase [Meiothermus granaticius NBRC 107808]